MKYDLIISNGHYVAVIDGENYVVDIGSPESFRFDLGDININGENFRSGTMTLTLQKINKGDIDKLVGLDIAGFIGNSIIREFGGVILDKDDMSVEFKNDAVREGENVCDINTLMHLYYGTEAVVNGKKMNVLLDTGARVSYASSEALEGLASTQKINDFAPSFGGNIETKGYDVDIELAGKKATITVGEYTGEMSLLGMFGIHGVIGINGLFEHRIMFDYENSKLVFA